MGLSQFRFDLARPAMKRSRFPPKRCGFYARFWIRWRVAIQLR